MTLSEELAWRGFVNQTTYKKLSALDGAPINFYWGVDPSADSMQVGNLAAAMLVKCFMRHKHHAVLLLGGATGMIGDPDGKSEERDLKSLKEIEHNKAALGAQYRQIFGRHGFKIVDNFDWFKGMGYLQFLRDVGKHAPLRQMLSRDFIQSRLGEGGAGISYAEFSYSLIQGYDFLHLHRHHGVTLQLAGADQWGNSIAGVELIRRITGGEAHVFTSPLVVNPTTGVKFGKTEAGAVWLDAKKTSPTQFYQFWINVEDEGVEDYLKIYTELDRKEIEKIMAAHREQPKERLAQIHLAHEVTRLVHGQKAMDKAENVTFNLIGKINIGNAANIADIREEVPSVKSAANGSVVQTLVESGLASSNTEARRLLSENAISINGQKVSREHFEASDFQNGRLLLRRGKAFKDSALVELR